MTETTYPKIETLFDRGADFTVDPERLRRVEFGLINSWVLTEKIDGTNIRLIFERTIADGGFDYNFDVRGKSDEAQIPPLLLNTLRAWCRYNMVNVAEIMNNYELSTYVLYGEGYGDRIQKGGRYREGQGFILFDIAAWGEGGPWWLDEQQITDTAEKLGIKRVPIVEISSDLSDAVNLVRNGGLASDATDVFDSQFMAEGIVAKTAVPFYDRRGERVMWKLKTKDFKAGKR